MDENQRDGLGFEAPGGAPAGAPQPQQTAPPAGTGGFPPQQTYDTSYAQPQAQHYAPVRRGSGQGWITLLRVFAWILFAAICLWGLIAGGAMMGNASYYRPELGFLGLLLMAASVLVAFVSVAGIMIFLDLAKNVANSATTLAEILRELRSRNAR